MVHVGVRPGSQGAAVGAAQRMPMERVDVPKRGTTRPSRGAAVGAAQRMS